MTDAYLLKRFFAQVTALLDEGEWDGSDDYPRIDLSTHRSREKANEMVKRYRRLGIKAGIAFLANITGREEYGVFVMEWPFWLKDLLEVMQSSTPSNGAL